METPGIEYLKTLNEEFEGFDVDHKKRADK
jgi:hypothetical protein